MEPHLYFVDIFTLQIKFDFKINLILFDKRKKESYTFFLPLTNKKIWWIENLLRSIAAAIFKFIFHGRIKKW